MSTLRNIRTANFVVAGLNALFALVFFGIGLLDAVSKIEYSGADAAIAFVVWGAFACFFLMWGIMYAVAGVLVAKASGAGRILQTLMSLSAMIWGIPGLIYAGWTLSTIWGAKGKPYFEGTAPELVQAAK